MISIQTFYFSQKKKKKAQTETEYRVRQLEQQFGFFSAPEERRWCRRRKQTGLTCSPGEASYCMSKRMSLWTSGSSCGHSTAQQRKAKTSFLRLQISLFHLRLIFLWNARLKHSCDQTSDVSCIVWMKAREIIWQQTGSPQQGRSNFSIFLSGLKNIWKLIIKVTTCLPTVETINLLIFHTKIHFFPP